MKLTAYLNKFSQKITTSGDRLLTPCEVAVKTISPAMRALLAQILIEKHGLKEIQVAQLLGITQSAVSKYSKKLRGKTLPLESIPEIQTITDQMVNLLLATPVDQTQVMLLFCQACTIIRSKGLMCPLCQQNQKNKIDNCNFCR
jgi:predicted transcriptional regulator